VSADKTEVQIKKCSVFLFMGHSVHCNLLCAQANSTKAHKTTIQYTRHIT